MQIYEQHWLSFTYVNSKQANRAVLGNASVCLQEEGKKGVCVARERGREINKQMETKIENRDGRGCLRSDEQRRRQSSGVKRRSSGGGGWMTGGGLCQHEELNTTPEHTATVSTFPYIWQQSGQVNKKGMLLFPVG